MLLGNIGNHETVKLFSCLFYPHELDSMNTINIAFKNTNNNYKFGTTLVPPTMQTVIKN